jgi:uncharacterized protein YqjF (DUF2071 family)
MRKFLSAKWNDLIMANYEVDPGLLAGRVPRGTELDLDDGRCFVSLVGFIFLNTRVLGVPVPFHVNFEEVNLRFYVQRKTAEEVRRGVVFIKEIVPRYAIAAVARAFYGEPYECWKTSSERDPKKISYSWQRNGCKNHISAVRGTNIGVPPENSHGSFIIEHYWGYTARGSARCDEYRVEHPKWEMLLAQNEVIDVDFGVTYGEEFAFLNGRKPYSVLVANGSEIAVFRGESLI